MAVTNVTESKELKKLINSLQEYLEKKGPVKEWTDSYLLKARDRFRKAAAKNRGKWCFEFYECLQELNKESIKRGLQAMTEH